MVKVKFETIKNYLRPAFPRRLIALWHLFQSVSASLVYRFPGKKIKVIGITGTNGKTTTAYLTESIFRQAGFRTALITTIATTINGKTEKNMAKMTTPTPWTLNKFLFRAWRAGCQVAIMEVTSHALAQERVFGIPFWAVAFTNVTHDHLDYHKTFKIYLEQKLKLFSYKARISVSNLDDKQGKIFYAQDAFKRYGVSVDPSRELDVSGKRKQKPEIFARKINYSSDRTDFILITPKGQTAISLKLPGRFNITNALIAGAIAQGMGISLAKIRSGLESLEGVKGRMEQIKRGQPFSVIIDYAHTPDAFLNIFRALKKIYPRKRIIHVFGATGARDKTKRPILGQISSRYASLIILTNEDPYYENPSKIIDAIYKGVPKAKQGKALRILSREKAIIRALTIARKGDVVLVTGKGHEEIMAVGASQKGPKGFRFIPFSDKKVILENLEKLGYKTIV